MFHEPEEGYLQFIIKNPFAWPGGYEVFAIMEDGEAVCHQCCTKWKKNIEEATKGSGWVIEGFSTTGEDDGYVYCANCNRVIREDWKDE